MSSDFLEHLERELHHAREDLACRVDRTEALDELRYRALTVWQQQKQRPLRVEDVFYGAAKDEKERAELRSLAERIWGTSA